ncbi:chitinase, partial [Streptomyces sp. MBT57]|nr:chitinase [Streptomyces sp. MBT57]
MGRTSRLLGLGLAAALVVPMLVGAAPPKTADSRNASAETCAVKSKPTGKVLQGYWENWDGAANGVHPPLGWIPITDPRITQHGYNVINAAQRVAFG